VLQVLLESEHPCKSLALALLRMMADAGVSRDVETWKLLDEAAFRQIFGVAGYLAFHSRRKMVWPEMQRLAPLLDGWP
jgi:hypothetical protein